MRNELKQCNKELKELLGVSPAVFAYPCGQKFVGRGVNTKSYVPVIAELFLSGRGWLDEAPNNPQFCDFAQLTGRETDGKNFEEIRAIIETAKKNGEWIVFAGHEMEDAMTRTFVAGLMR